MISHTLHPINQSIDLRRVSKNVTPLARYTFDTRERISIFFGRNAVPIKYAIKRRFTTPPQTTCASALPGKTGNTKRAFFTQVLYYCIARIQPVAAWFLQSFWLSTHTHAAVSCNQRVQFGAIGGMVWWFRRKEVESAAAVGLCCTHKAPVRYLLGFLFRKVMLKHWTVEVGKQSIVWFLTFSTTLLPKIDIIGSCSKSKVGGFWDIAHIYVLTGTWSTWPVFTEPCSRPCSRPWTR